MKIIVDQHIPYLLAPLSTLCEVVALPAAAIDAAAVRDADALIVRTRTRCDAALLEGSRVRLIVTATIGYDHIDTAWCEAHGIRWTNCPGCNASSVCQYVECALRLMEREGVLALAVSTIAVIGVGHVGSRVQAMAQRLGMNVLPIDPPRGLLPTDALWDADVVTLHVPLTTDGPCPTYHLADEAFFASLRRRPLFINTSRGPVADTDALVHALADGQIRQAVIDVWEHEPHPDARLLSMARLTTPHIAGYSADGKARASQMALDALALHFGLPAVAAQQPPLADAPYDIDADSRRLKASPDTFEQQRTHYPLRRE